LLGASIDGGSTQRRDDADAPGTRFFELAEH
jgi:hypothetical protein